MIFFSFAMRIFDFSELGGDARKVVEIRLGDAGNFVVYFSTGFSGDFGIPHPPPNSFPIPAPN
jgi:hypothetical protein